MADEAVATDSAAPAESATASSGSAVVQDDATHGGAAEQATSSETEGVPSETPDESAELDDNAFEDQIKDLPEEEKKTKSQERRERRQKRDQERIDQQVADRLAAREREQAAEAERKQQADEAARIAKARIDRLASWVGVPDAPDKPGTVSTIQSEIADLTRQIRDGIADPSIDVEALNEQIVEKEARLDRLRENQAMSKEIEDFVLDFFTKEHHRVREIPEMGENPDAVQRYLTRAMLHEANVVLADTVRAAERARGAEEIAKVRAEHKQAMSLIEADRDTWRTRAGGAEVADTTSGGTASLSDQLLTPERYARMDWQERIKLRSTPEGRARIDAMTRRSGAA